MNFLKPIIFFFTIPIFVYSCDFTKKVSVKRDNKQFNKYLLEIVNDTNLYELPSLKIIDDNFYAVLDSVIVYTEKCQYFDYRLKKFYAFSILLKEKKGIDIYSIYAHQSIENALGLLSNRASGLNKPNNVGVFNYKNYLFVIPILDTIEKEKEFINFPFCIQSACNYKLAAPALYKKAVYSSYIDFVKQHNTYIITNNNICGKQILIE